MDQLERIRSLVCRIGGLSSLDFDENMADAGFSSINALELLLELESEFDVTVPDDRYIEARTVRALSEMIESLREAVPA